jgi:IclR family transcriptional regulator, acetate operon repressor
MRNAMHSGESAARSQERAVTGSGAPVPRERYRVQSVDRALTMLEALAEAGAEGLTLAEAGRRLGTSKSTALSLLRTLAGRGFVTLLDEGERPRYRLGLALARLGDQVVAQTGLVEISLPVLRQLTAETGRTSRLGVLDDGYVVIIGRVPGPGFIQVQSHLGRRELPHCSALGKAILSQLPEATVREIAARVGMPGRTPRTITNVKRLLVELTDSRQRGYAVDDEEDSVGVFCVGAPVIDHRGACVGAISVTDVRLSSGGDSVPQIAAVVVQRALALSALLGAHRVD